MQDGLDINPQTKVGEMLDAYPLLEEVLLELSPTFVKLKNPILRKTVARVVSLKQAAEMGDVPIGDMITKLRSAANLDTTSSIRDVAGYSDSKQPDWLDMKNIQISFDATNIINSGDNPMKEILDKVKELEEYGVMELITPFTPIPLINILEKKSYLCWSNKMDDKTYTYLKVNNIPPVK